MTHQVRCGSVLSTQCTICFISSKGLAGSGKLLWKHPESCCTHNTFRLNLPSLSMWLPWSCIYLLFQKVTLKTKKQTKLSILHINAMLWFARSEQTLQVTTIQGWENTTNTCLTTNYIHCNLVLVLKFSACKKDSANYWHLYCGQPGLQAPTFQSQVTLLNSVLPPLRFICLCTIWWFGVLSHLHDLVIWRSRVSVNLFSSPKQSWTQYCHRGFFLSAQLGDVHEASPYHFSLHNLVIWRSWVLSTDLAQRPLILHTTEATTWVLRLLSLCTTWWFGVHGFCQPI